MTLKLEGDLDILKIYIHTENEVARLRHSKVLTVDEICMENEKYELTFRPIGNDTFLLHYSVTPCGFRGLE